MPDFNDPAQVAAELERRIARARKQVMRGEATPAQAAQALALTWGASPRLAMWIRTQVAA